MKICTTLQRKVISSSDDEALDKEDTFKQGRIDEIDVDEDIALVSTHDDVSTQDNIVQDEGIEDVGEEEVVEVVTTTKMIIDVVVDAAQVTTTIADIPVSDAETIVTTAPTITAESTKTNVEVTQASKRKGVMIQEPEETTTTKTASSQQPWVQDKEEQEQLTDPEKAKLFMEFLEKERRLFAAKRDEERRNKPTTKAQQRSLMCTYLKNMNGWKIKSLKKKSFAKIQELFDKAMKRINTFVDFRTELVDESSKKAEVEITQEDSLKRAGDELEQETTKKQKIVDDKETTNLKQLVKIIPKEDIAIDAIPLAIKTLTVDWKIYKEGKKSYYQIIRAG
nr:hypothetical protein [Tanacetum cinerariifolium]